MKSARFLLCLIGIAVGTPSMGLPCSSVPEDAAELVFRVLENQGGNPAVVSKLYEQEFANEFKKNYSFQQFYSQLRLVQRDLRIGVDQNRSWESRGLGSGEAFVELIGKSPTVYSVQFLTTSPVGKIGQRAYVICERDEWKLTGIWYFPLSSSSARPGLSGNQPR